VTKTVTVLLVSSVEKTTVNSFIPTLKRVVIVATMGVGQLYHCIVTTIMGSLTTFTQLIGVSWGVGEVVGNMREFSAKYIKVKLVAPSHYIDIGVTMIIFTQPT